MVTSLVPINFQLAMLNSLRSLFKSEFNKKNKMNALKRFFYWKTIRLLKLKDVVYPFWTNRKILLNYDSFHSMWLMYNYIVDWEEFTFMSKFLEEDDQVCDIGTNIGFYTIWMSKFIKNGKIHSFEPDDINFSRLINNVKLNSLNNIVSLNKLIVSETDGKLNFTMQLDGENHITNSFDSKGIQKSSIQLDTYSKKKQITAYKFVKIDTEGFELSVLMGAEKLLDKKKIKVIQLEINAGLKTSNIEPKDLVNYLSSKDYKLCRYNVLTNQLYYTNYQPAKENYFATYDLDGVNNFLSKKNN